MNPYLTDDNITLYHGDARIVLPTLTTVAHLLYTDPPYGTDGGVGYGRKQNYSGVDVGMQIAGDDSLDTLHDVLKLAHHYLREDSWAFVWASPRMPGQTENLLANADFDVVDELVWDKGSAGLSQPIRYQHEKLLIAKYGNPPSPDRAMMSIYRAPRGTVRSKLVSSYQVHPHRKPVGLARIILDNWMPMNGTVIDPFAGGGSTLRAAKDTGAAALGIELDERWCRATREMLAQETLFGD